MFRVVIFAFCLLLAAMVALQGCEDPASEPLYGGEEDDDESMRNDDWYDENDTNASYLVDYPEVGSLFAMMGFSEEELESYELASMSFLEPEGVSCAFQEALSRNIDGMKKDKAIALPEVLRFLFHDSADANNLMVKDMETRQWTLVQEKDGSPFGGVDGCLYSPLSGGNKGMYEPQHNENVHQNLGFVSEACRRICKASKSGICRSLGSCVVDVAVLGSVLQLNKKSQGQTNIEMVWGRNKGRCKAPLQVPWSEAEQKVVNYSKLPALRFAPALHALDNPDKFRRAFERLDFTAVEQAALMGGHSVGRVTACAGGLNGIERGPWCGNGQQLRPPLNSSNMEKNGCIAKVGIKSNCWRKRGNGLTPIFARNKANEQAGRFTSGFSDGGFFDATPRKFDNEYYKEFANEKYDSKDNCCGSVVANGCHRVGTMKRITKRSPSGRPLASRKISGVACSVTFCRSDRDGRTHMKSTKIWHEPEGHKGLDGKGTHHGTTLRIQRLAGDWALLGREDTKAAVKLFAEDEQAWHREIGKAWAKVVSKGYEPGRLRACVNRPISEKEEKQRKALWR